MISPNRLSLTVSSITLSKASVASCVLHLVPVLARRSIVRMFVSLRDVLTLETSCM